MGVDTEAMVLVWDTGPMAMVDMVLAIVDTMESVRLKLSPKLMLIPTTMVDMDLEDTMVDTEAMVLVWDTGPMAMVDMVLAIVDTMASVRLMPSPRLMLIPTTMVDMDWDMVDMVDTGAMVMVWDIGTMVLAMAMVSMAVKSDLRIKELYTFK